MTNDTSRPSASGTTGPIELVVDGQPVPMPEPPPAIDSAASTQIHIAAHAMGHPRDFRVDVPDETLGIVHEMLAKLYPDYRVIDFTGRKGRVRVWREEARFRLWELRAKAKHALGFHTMIPLEEWDTTNRSIQFVGKQCWLCPEQTR